MRLFCCCVLAFLVISFDVPTAVASGPEIEVGRLGTSVHPEEPYWTSRPEEQMFFLSVATGNLTLTDSLTTYYNGKNFLIPLGRLATVLEFPIFTDPAKGTAKGWFFDESKTFSLDMSPCTVILSGVSQNCDPDLLERHKDDIYVVSDLLENWFSIRLKPDVRNLHLEVDSRLPFAAEERKARQSNRAGLSVNGSSDASDAPVEPEADFFEWPFVDVSLSANSFKTGTNEDSRITQTATVAGVIGDLDAEATYYAADKFKSPNLRVRVGRKSLDGDLLGPLRAHEYAIGDIATPLSPLISENVVGRGVMVSSFDLNDPGSSNQITLRGNLPAGWEVELYRNQELLDFQTGADVGGGRYEFKNVPTVIGLNEFRLVFYGPQGQKREKTEEYFISPDLGKSGKTSFRLAVNQADTDMITFEEPEFTAVDTGKERLVFQLERGLTDTTSVRTGLVSLSLDGVRHNYVSAGLGTSVSGSLLNLDLGVDTEGGFALGGSIQKLIGSWSVTAKQQWFNDFVSERADDLSIGGEDIVSYSVLQLIGRLPEGWGLAQGMPASATLEHRMGENNSWQSDFTGRVSYFTRNYNAALASTVSIGSIRDIDSRLSLIGSTSGPLRWRGEINIDPFDSTIFESSSIYSDWRITEKTGGTAGISYLNDEKDTTSFGVGLYHRFDQLNLGMDMSADTEDNYSLGVSLSFSLGHNPTDQTIEMHGDQFARSGAVSTKVFLDRNNDGIFNEGDKPIEKVGFSGPGSSKIRTSEQGSAFIPGIVPYQKVRIGLDEETLLHPTWRVAEPPKLLSLRPGMTAELQFPVIETGEIDGWVFGEGDGNAPLPGIRIWAINKKGEKAGQAVSAFDGYYNLGELPLGTYDVVPDSQQLSALGYADASAISAQLEGEEPFVLDQNFDLKRRKR